MVSRAALSWSLMLGVVASVLLAAGLLIIKTRAKALPMARGRTALHAVIAWIQDPIWLGGLVVETAGYVTYIIALEDAPVSMMVVAMQGGIVLFIIFAVVFLGERARMWEWVGIAAFATAAAMLAGSLGTGAARSVLDGRALAEASFIAAAVALALLAASSLKESGAAVAIVSGIGFGLGSLYTKALADVLAREPHTATLIASVLTCPYAYLAAAANVCGLVMLQNSFAMERGIIAMPLSSAFSNMVPIIGGMVAFGEHLPDGTTSAVMRAGAFVLTIAAGAALAAGNLGTKAP